MLLVQNLSAQPAEIDAQKIDPAQVIAIGGALTHYDRSRDAFSRPASGLSMTELRRFGLGNRVFNTRWVEAPASVSGFDGLGPTFNRDSCSGCHQRDGRGRPPDASAVGLKDTFVVKVTSEHRRTRRRIAKTYGPQLNTSANAGAVAEGKVSLRYQEIPGRYDDGTPYALRRPIVEVRDALFPIDRRVQLHLRVAPAVFGLGLIEAVPVTTLITLADPTDSDRDGISGRINWIASSENKLLRAGRFGWKARAPSLADQSLDAAFEDIGLTSGARPRQNCPRRQTACASAFRDAEVELRSALLTALVGYLQTLGVPARATSDEPLLRSEGFRLFRQFKCDSCHRPLLVTDDAHPEALLRNQVIFPFSDFLLHDMGIELAGAGDDGEALATEWRTPPLWGLSLLETVNGHSLLLHDGRARSVAEAVLWHGGEGSAAREAFRNAPSEERDTLSKFVMSL